PRFRNNLLPVPHGKTKAGNNIPSQFSVNIFVTLLYLKLIAIRKVVIESWAFRGILRSPRELIIQESNLPRIPTNAFTGLSNLKHIWFRNCTITSIAANAFEYLSNVEYIYFRDATIVQLDNFAFSNESSVDFIGLGW
uniref:Uncharacterized protein n=1 Tax=Parascaris equorum TaxID=6256 RepID=A0A914R6M5_PAREQ